MSWISESWEKISAEIVSKGFKPYFMEEELPGKSEEQSSEAIREEVGFQVQPENEDSHFSE